MSHLVENNNSSEKRWELVNFCEFDKYAVKSYCAIHNVDESLNLGDITKIDDNWNFEIKIPKEVEKEKEERKIQTKKRKKVQFGLVKIVNMNIIH